LTEAGLASGPMTFASVLDSLGDVSSLVLGALAFGLLFLAVAGLDRVR
jgi:hypothetical protein